MNTLKDFNFPYRTQKKYRSVSSLISSIKEPFDRDGISKRVANNRGMTQKSVLAEWDKKGADSRVLGNRVHEYIYQVLNDTQPQSGLETLSPRLPQFDQFDNFWKAASENYQVVWTEKTVSSPTYQVGGRVDTVLYHPKNKTYHVIDWKTGELDSQGWNRLFPPFDDLTDSKVTLGALQLSIYALVIATEAKVTLGESYLVYISENSYQVKAVEDYQHRVGEWLKMDIAEKALTP